MAKRIIEYLNGTTKLTSPILMHITLNSIPKIKNTAVADKAPKTSIEGITQTWNGANRSPVNVTDAAVIRDIKVEGILWSNFFVERSRKTIKKTAPIAINE